jgi:hypothetical protein
MSFPLLLRAILCSIWCDVKVSVCAIGRKNTRNNLLHFLVLSAGFRTLGSLLPSRSLDLQSLLYFREYFRSLRHNRQFIVLSREKRVKILVRKRAVRQQSAEGRQTSVPTQTTQKERENALQVDLREKTETHE